MTAKERAQGGEGPAPPTKRGPRMLGGGCDGKQIQVCRGAAETKGAELREHGAITAEGVTHHVLLHNHTGRCQLSLPGDSGRRSPVVSLPTAGPLPSPVVTDL